MKKILFIHLLSVIFFLGTLSSCGTKNTLPKYKNKRFPNQERVTDLLSRMTIEEKIAQLTGYIQPENQAFDTTFFSDTIALQKIFGHGINSIQPTFSGIQVTVESRNKLQHFLMEKTRLGIPAIFVDEGQHGLMRPGSTCFPQAIGLACSWDTQLIREVYSVVGQEMRSRGTHFALSPVVDVCRDPRWGRVEETYGEDPYLNGALGTAAVRGLQGSSNGIVAPMHVAATLKHFVGHGQPEGGLNQAPANYSLRILREAHMPPFKTIIDSAYPVAIMPSYNEVDGIPSHMNTWLLKDVLREEWNFEGLIVSDYNGIDELYQKHLVAANGKEAAERSFNAGVQVEFPMGNLFHYLPELLKEKKIKPEDIDNAVKKVLTLKFQLGLFENPYVSIQTAEMVSHRSESKLLALKAAQEAIVLLKNENNLLPLSKTAYKKIAVIGPCASHVYTGGYSGEPYQKVSLLNGIKQKVGSNSQVLYAPGCILTTNDSLSYYNWKNDAMKIPSVEENKKLIQNAVALARTADVIILAVGENEFLCREAWAKNHLGDENTLDLFGQQDELVHALVALGKPMVVYLMNGRPLAVNFIASHVPCILEGWYMGEQTGEAAADIIFGDINPSGKLTITIPKSVGQIPIYYNHKPSAQFQNYVSQDAEPLFPFGFGLSYSSFKYDNLKLSKSRINKNEKVFVSVDVLNTGMWGGDEIVELYIHDKISSVTRPVLELKDFKRIHLNTNEKKTVTFCIDPSKLSFWDINMAYTEEPGDFDIMIGRSSHDFLTVKLTVL